MCRCAVHPLLGQLPEQLLFPKQALQKEGLYLLLESIGDEGEPNSSSTADLLDKFL